jgi:hypothetical protein
MTSRLRTPDDTRRLAVECGAYLQLAAAAYERTAVPDVTAVARPLPRLDGVAGLPGRVVGERGTTAFAD